MQPLLLRSNGQSNIPAIDDVTVEPSLQPAEEPAVTFQSQKITVDQLLASGPYRIDVERKLVLAKTLKRYKAKVDEVHGSGRVRQMTHNQLQRMMKACALIPVSAGSATMYSMLEPHVVACSGSPI